MDAPLKLCSQLFTIHGLYRGTRRNLTTKHIYCEVFDTLRRKIAETKLVLNLTKIMLDFESRLLPILRTQFPNATIKGCYFHHTKALTSDRLQ